MFLRCWYTYIKRKTDCKNNKIILNSTDFLCILSIYLCMKLNIDYSFIYYKIYEPILSHCQDLFGVSILLPSILPQIKSFGISFAEAGIINSIYGGLQLLTSPTVVC